MFSHPRGAFSTLIHETICHISEEFSASLLIVWGLLMKSSRRGLFFYDGLSPWTDFECSHNGRRWISFHFFCRSSPYWTKMLMETFHFVMMYSTNVFSLLFVTFHQFAIFSYFFLQHFHSVFLWGNIETWITTGGWKHVLHVEECRWTVHCGTLHSTVSIQNQYYNTVWSVY